MQILEGPDKPKSDWITTALGIAGAVLVTANDLYTSGGFTWRGFMLSSFSAICGYYAGDRREKR